MAYWGRFNAANPTTLPIGGAFQAAGGREWLVRFWQLEGKWVGIALPFGIILWVLFFFDHNVSVSPAGEDVFLCFLNRSHSQSLMAQGSEFPLRKPPGFHWDFFLLGVTTFIAGLIGVPAPNGLIPQAPIHTSSLLIMGRPPRKEKDEEEQRQNITPPSRRSPIGEHRPALQDTQTSPDLTDVDLHEVAVAVVEQRVSNLAQGALCLVLLTGPFLHILNLIPRGVLAGLLWVPYCYYYHGVG